MQWVPDALQDLRFALRLFRRRPGFALLAALTLAFGIGATTAVYTIVHAVLLGSPYRDSGRIVVIWDNNPRDGDQVRQILAPPADFEEYKRSARFLEHISTAGRTRPMLKFGGSTQERLAGLVPSNLFRETLGVDAALGRVFTADDERGGCSVVLAHGFWTATLGGDKAVLGRSLTLDGTSCAVLGVLPQGFTFFPNTADMWFLMGHSSKPEDGPPFGMVTARLKSGATIEQARAEIAALHQAANTSRPARGDRQPGLVPAVDYIRSELTFLTTPTLRASLLLTFGAVSLLLLIACLNVANLLLARLSERQRELVVRTALGSGRVRLIRQVLAEGLLLAVAGTALGIAFAAAAVRWFRYSDPVKLPPHAGGVPLDRSVLLFAIALSVATTLVFGLLPALQASRVGLSQSLKAAGRGFVGLSSRRRTAQIMVGVEMAVSFVLLIGAGLLMSSVLRLGSEALGFDPNGVVTVDVTLPVPRYSNAADKHRFLSALLERIKALPGVEGAVFGGSPPWDPQDNIAEEQIQVEGQNASESSAAKIQSAGGSPGLFEILKTPLLRGRFFEDRDLGTPVAIVSQTLVDQHFAGKDPIGQRIRHVEDGSPWLTIVGVVGTWKHLVNDASWRDTPLLFTPLRGLPISVRSGRDPAVLKGEIQRVVADLDSAVTVKPELVNDRLAKVLIYPRFRAEVLACFSLGALLLAAVGLHGVLSQLVSQRTPEFGVRRAVGAQTRDLFLLVARQGGIPVIAGLAAGIASALAFSSVLASILYGIQPADPRLLATVSVTLIVAAALAIAMPARRAARVDPMVALRDE